MTKLATHFYHVTQFDDVAAKVARDHVLNLPQLRDMILDASAPTKSALPWLKLARFGKRRSGTGCLRHNDNVRSFTGIELDYDGEAISLAAAVAKLKKLGCRGLIYTSPSHRKAKPRWRLLLPVSHEIFEPDRRRVLVRRVDGFFGWVFAEESYTLSTAFYFGRALDNAEADHRCVVVDGDYVDLRQKLAEFDEPVPPPLDPEELAAILEDVAAGRGVSDRPEDNIGFGSTPEDLEQKMRAALAVIPSDDYHCWIKVGAAIRDGLGDAGGGLFHEWSQTSAKYDDRECTRKWERSIPSIRRVTVATIFWLADQHDPEWRDLYRQARAAGVRL
jgi:hypothetical protein